MTERESTYINFVVELCEKSHESLTNNLNNEEKNKCFKTGNYFDEEKNKKYKQQYKDEKVKTNRISYFSFLKKQNEFKDIDENEIIPIKQKTIKIPFKNVSTSFKEVWIKAEIVAKYKKRKQRKKKFNQFV